MDALLTAFLAALLGEFGDKTQLLVVALAIRFRAPGPILTGVAVGVLANGLIAGAAGMLVHGIITLRSTSMLVAVVLIFAGVAGFIRRDEPEMIENWKNRAFLTSAASVFLVEFGDKTQFLTFGIAAQYDSLLLAAAGATAGVVAAAAPPALMADRFAATFPLTPIRIGVAILFLIAGFVVAINALRLV